MSHSVTQFGFKGEGASNDVLNFLLNTTGTIYAALMTVAPTATGGGTEVTGGGYARVAITCNTTNFPSASGAAISNGVAFDFGTATSDWAPSASQVVGVAFVKTSSGALGSTDIVYYTELTSTRVILNGDPVKIPIGGVTITEV